MQRTKRSITLLVLAVSFSTARLAAQIPSNIDWAVLGSDGVTVNGEYARGLNNDSGKDNYIGGRIVVPLSKASVFGGAGFMSCSGCGLSSRVGAGGGVAVHLRNVSDGSLALTAQAGFGFSKVSGDFIWGIPVGVAVAPVTTGKVQPWVMPMLAIQNNGFDTKIGFSAAGGADIALSDGFGAHAGLQFTAISGISAIGIGAGLHYELP